MSSISDGYTCGCGTWVPYGTQHKCPTTVWVNPPETWPYLGSADNAILERIAKALERIADTIDR